MLLFPSQSSSSSWSSWSSSSSSSRAATLIGRNSDLLIKILLHLPLEFLLIVKSVSKQWLSLISDPYFVFLWKRKLQIPALILHQKLNFYIKPPIYKIILLHETKTTDIVPFRRTLDFVNDPLGIEILQSCNGLLLCSTAKSRNHRYPTSYYIYNPSTKKFKILPLSSPYRYNLVRSINLAFDQLKSPHYKVVCISQDSRMIYDIEIYSSRTGTWRFTQISSYLCDEFSGSGVFWNGNLHWISWNMSFIYFDLGKGLFGTMPMPKAPTNVGTSDSVKIGYFGENRGHLYLIEIYSSKIGCFDILEMASDYSRWNVKYSVDCSSLINGLNFSILMVEEYEDDSPKLVLQVKNAVFSYDIKNMKYEKTQDLVTSGRYKRYNAYQYIEALACV